MQGRLTPATTALLLVPPLLWAGNAVVGRMVQHIVPPITLNLLRWVVAFFILLPLAAWVLRRQGGCWPQWRRFALLGLLGVGSYNTLQYLALKTSTPINVTLVAGSSPLFLLLVGRLCYGQRVARQQVWGALLSLSGVVLVLSRGSWTVLRHFSLVPGDLYILAATLVWAFYSWQLRQPDDRPDIRTDWAAFLLAQVTLGLAWSGLFAAGEWALTDAHIVWGWPLVATLAYVAAGPAVLAYRCWDLGIQRVGPVVAGFFGNLTPLFAALMSTVLLGELPHLYHALAFILIIVGIWVSSPRR